jgi:hypothetical protein
LKLDHEERQRTAPFVVGFPAQFFLFRLQRSSQGRDVRLVEFDRLAQFLLGRGLGGRVGLGFLRRCCSRRCGGDLPALTGGGGVWIPGERDRQVVLVAEKLVVPPPQNLACSGHLRRTKPMREGDRVGELVLPEEFKSNG